MGRTVEAWRTWRRDRAWGHPLRFPIGVALNLLIIAAAVSAYSASRSDGGVELAPQAVSQSTADSVEDRIGAAPDGEENTEELSDPEAGADGGRASGSFSDPAEPTTAPSSTLPSPARPAVGGARTDPAPAAVRPPAVGIAPGDADVTPATTPHEVGATTTASAAEVDAAPESITPPPTTRPTTTQSPTTTQAPSTEPPSTTPPTTRPPTTQAPTVAAPPACDVQIGSNSYAGVEIRDPNRNWAPGYVFYGSAGDVIVRTVDLGPPDDTTNPDRNQIEWTSRRYGFEERDVYTVAAEDAAGNVSERVTCSRRRV